VKSPSTSKVTNYRIVAMKAEIIAGNYNPIHVMWQIIESSIIYERMKFALKFIK